MRDGILTDYHTHTCYSHGKGTPEENVRAAMDLGLRAVAISEHGPGSFFCGVRGDKLRRLRREVDRLNGVYGDQIRVLMGLEANLLADGMCDLPGDIGMFDVVLLGYHRAVLPRDGLMWRAVFTRFTLAPDARVRVARAMVRTMERYPIDIIAHPGEYLPVDIPTLARGAARLGVALEINAKHLSMSVAELQQAAEEGAAFVINSDAHWPDAVGRVEAALALARAAGVLRRVTNRPGADRELTQGLRLSREGAFFSLS